MLNSLDGKQISYIAERTFGRTDLTKEELIYVLTMLNPVSYALKHHSVKNHPITFHISNRDSTRAQAHRPWQSLMLQDQHPNKTIIKSRQLGLSELGVAELLWFADVYSYASVKCLYTFPFLRRGTIE